MCRAIKFVMVVASTFANVAVSPDKTVDETEARITQFHNVISVSGLHVALPEDMKNFPVELVPLP